MATIVTVIPIMSLFIIAVLCYFKKYGEQQLTPKHILYCLGLWVSAKVLLIPSHSFDIVYHHAWKIIGAHYPTVELYYNECFSLDYTPLFAYF